MIAVLARVHGSALFSSPGQLVLVVIGIVLGTSAVLAVLVVDSALSRPFLGLAQLTTPPEIQVLPLVEHGLPEDSYRAIAELPSVEAAAPVVGGITLLHNGDASEGVYVLGSTCEIEEFLGEVDCGRRLDAAPGTGYPLWLASSVADRLGLSPGDTFAASGWQRATAYVAGVLSDEQLGQVNDGRLALGLVPDVADITGSPGNLSAVLVRSLDPAATEREVAQVLGDGVRAGTPDSWEPPILAAARRSMFLNGGIAAAVGMLVAATTLMTAFSQRRHSLAMLSILGMRRANIFVGLMAEGGLLGGLAGLIAVLPGFGLGRYLAETFGAGVLSGTGMDVSAEFTWLLPVAGLVVGVGTGVAAAAFSAAATLRQPPLEVLGQSSLVAKPGKPRYILVPIGMAVVAVAFVLAVPFGKGMLPLPIGFGALAILPWGMALLVMGITPALVAAYRKWVPIRTASGLLARADLARSPMQTAGAVVMLALAIGTFAPSMNLRTFASEAIGHRGDELVADGVLLGARKVGEQSTAVLSDAVLEDIASWEEVVAADPILRAPVDLSVPTVIVGLDTGSELARREMERIGLGDDAVGAVADGGVILSTLAANHLGAGVGDQVQLPVVGGTETFDVAAIADPSFVDDTGIGDAIVADADTAREQWRARPTFAVVTPAEGHDAAAVQERVSRTYGDLVSAVDSAEFGRLSAATVSKFLSPIITLGWAVVVAAGIGVLNLLLLGLMQRRRERALHRAMGMDAQQEYRTSLMESGVIGSLGALFGVGATLLFSLQLSVVAPVFLTTSVGWRPVPGPIVVGIVGAVIAGLFGSFAPLVEARRFDVVGLISGD